MQPTSRLEIPRTAMKLHALISDLRWRVQLLDSDIQDEEKRTGISNVSNLSDPCPKSENQTWQSLGHDHDAGEPVGRNGRGRLTTNRWRWLRRTVEGPLLARGEEHHGRQPGGQRQAGSAPPASKPTSPNCRPIVASGKRRDVAKRLTVRLTSRRGQKAK